MPGSNFSEEQAARVVAYLRSVAASKRSDAAVGDASRGHALFDGKGTCLTCHRVSGNGSRLGPDLTNVGQLRRAMDLERSLLDPDAEVLGTNRFYRVVTRDGVTTTGRLLNLDTFTVQMLDSKEQLRSFVKSDLREHGFVEKSPMPSYKDKLSTQELADVVSYLVSLKVKVIRDNRTGTRATKTRKHEAQQIHDAVHSNEYHEATAQDRRSRDLRGLCALCGLGGSFVVRPNR